MKNELYEIEDYWDIKTVDDDEDYMDYTILTLKCSKIGEITVSIPNFGYQITISATLEEAVTEQELEEFVNYIKEIELDKILQFREYIWIVCQRIRHHIINVTHDRKDIYHSDEDGEHKDIYIHDIMDDIVQKYKSNDQRFLIFTKMIHNLSTESKEIIDRKLAKMIRFHNEKGSDERYPSPMLFVKKRYESDHIYDTMSCAYISEIENGYDVKVDTSLRTRYESDWVNVTDGVLFDIERLKEIRMFIRNQKLEKAFLDQLFRQYHSTMLYYSKRENKRREEEKKNIEDHGVSEVPIDDLKSYIQSDLKISENQHNLIDKEYDLNVWVRQLDLDPDNIRVKNTILQIEEEIKKIKTTIKSSEVTKDKITRKYKINLE